MTKECEMSPLWFLWFELIKNGVIHWTNVKDSKGNPVKCEDEVLIHGVPEGEILDMAVEQAKIKTLWHHSGLEINEVMYILGFTGRRRVNRYFPPPKPLQVEIDVALDGIQKLTKRFREEYPENTLPYSF